MAPKVNFDGRVITHTHTCNAQVSCEQECLVGDWGAWSHPDLAPEGEKDIWEENVGGALQVRRTRSIIMAPSDGDLTTCPARVEYMPWKDHCVMNGMGPEHNTRECDTSGCTAGAQACGS